MNLKRRGTLLCGILSLFTIVACVIVGFSWRSCSCPVDIREETSLKLKNGMTEAEVEGILRGPAGNYTTHPGVEYVFVTAGNVPQILARHAPITKRRWHTDEYAIDVYFGAEGEAIWIHSAAADEPPPSMRYPPPIRQILHPFIDR
jgi:hypothetical protein